MGGVRLGFGIVMIIAAAVVAGFGYINVPSAASCNYANSVSAQLGQSATCSTSPSPGYFVAAVILAIIGLLFTAPWWLRWIAGKKVPS